jgi:hypothetical protein
MPQPRITFPLGPHFCFRCGRCARVFITRHIFGQHELEHVSIHNSSYVADDTTAL